MFLTVGFSNQTVGDHRRVVQLCGEQLAGQVTGGRLAGGAGLVGGTEGVGGAELHGGGVLQCVLARLHLKGRPAHAHQPPAVAAAGARFAPGRVRRGSPAAHAARREERQRHQQQQGADDDGRVLGGHELAEREGPHKGDVNAGQHDAEPAGAAQSRGGQALGTQLPLPGHLLGD